MNLKVNFISKITKAKTLNEILFIKGKKIKNNILSPIIKTVLDNKLFQDQLIIQKEYKNVNFIFVNCKKLSTSTDFENIGSKLFEYLNKNKIENSYIDFSKADINHIQLEKVLHGAKLKSYKFDIYKTNNKNKKNINLNVFEKQKNKSNILRKKLDALLNGVFFTRDLVSEPGNILHPDEYAKRLILM